MENSLFLLDEVYSNNSLDDCQMLQPEENMKFVQNVSSSSISSNFNTELQYEEHQNIEQNQNNKYKDFESKPKEEENNLSYFHQQNIQLNTKNHPKNDEKFSVVKNNSIEAVSNKSTGKRTRVPFTSEEDEKLRKLVAKFGGHNWSIISSFMKDRTSKQCRDRYSNYLTPGYFQGEWSKGEDNLLIQLYNQFGPKWTFMQKYFKGRSSNSIKNRWNYFLCRQIPTNNDVNGKERMEGEKCQNISGSLSVDFDCTLQQVIDESFLLFEKENETIQIFDDDNYLEF